MSRSAGSPWKPGGKPVKRKHDVAIEREHRDHPFVRGAHEPFREWHRQLESTLRMQDLRLPHADRRDAETALFGRPVERVAFRRR